MQSPDAPTPGEKSGLGWDTDDFDEVRRQYPVKDINEERGFVDYCLCAREGPRVLIEAKPAEVELSRHQAQLLRYAYQEGVELAALTNGLDWWLYLPMVGGEQAHKRRFSSVNLREQSYADSAATLHRFLNRDHAVSGEAKNEAERELENQKRNRLVRSALPEAWRRVDGDSRLQSLLAEFVGTVEERSGHMPDREAITGFMQDKLASVSNEGGPSAAQTAQMAAGNQAQTPAKPSISAGSDEARPRRQARTRVDTTIDAMRRPEGVTVTELVALFEDEFGNGKRSTAKQAIYKAPAARGLKPVNTGEKRNGEPVYRIYD